jgi:hypothetical protein
LSDTAGIMDTQLLAILKFSFELITKENELLKEEIKQLKSAPTPASATTPEPVPAKYSEQDVKNIYQTSPEAFDWIRKHDHRRKAMIASAVAILQNELDKI